MPSHQTEPTAIVPEANTIQYFFELLYGRAHDGYLVLSYPDPAQLRPDGTHPFASRWYDLAESPWALIAQEACKASAQANLYFGVVLQSPTCKPHRGKRGQTATAYRVPALWADIDLAYGEHQASALPQSDEELLDFLHAFPMLPSLIVHSGGGMYPFWLFDKPLIMTTPDERRAVQHLSDRFGRTILERGKQRGWTLDVVSDLPRVLRPPGTINHKYGRVVELIHESGLRYSPGDFEPWLVNVPAKAPRVARDNGEGMTDLPDIRSVAEYYGAGFTRETADELSGAHPVHGSSTGFNFSVNTTDQVWHCWRHGTGGGVLQLVAVCEGLLECEDAKPRALQGRRFMEVVSRTNHIFGASIPLRPRDAAEYARQHQAAADDRITERMAQAHVQRNGHTRPPAGGRQGQDETKEEVPYVAKPWPQCHPAAFHGIVGKIVKAIEPQTESDPVGLLVQTLVMAGNVIGRTAHFAVEADRHFVNLFSCLVGETSKARKGTSARYPIRILREVDDAWGQRLESGMSSGEGLIWAVRDPVQGIDAKTNKPTTLDAGVSDKRLCILESEFARALKKTGDSGNTLSAVLRQAWDEGILRTLVSGRHKAPIHATNAHVSIVAHITAEELSGLLSQVDILNGFANRFLWVCVKRANLLPDGGLYPEQELASLKDELAAAIVHAGRVGTMTRTDEAKALWREVYEVLAVGKPGLLGAITARGEAQVLRLSCLYALLDKNAMVDVPHLLAALALWDYCEASACYLFGDELGDPLAASIHQKLQDAGDDGISRTALNRSFGSHVLSAVIHKALQKLHQQGRAKCVKRKGKGRSADFWYAATPAASPQGDLHTLITHLIRTYGDQNHGLYTGGDDLNTPHTLNTQPPSSQPHLEGAYDEGII